MEEKLLKEILVELKKINSNIDKISSGYNIYDTVQAVHELKSTVNDLADKIK